MREICENCNKHPHGEIPCFCLCHPKPELSRCCDKCKRPFPFNIYPTQCDNSCPCHEPVKEEDWKGGGADEVIDRLKEEGKCPLCVDCLTRGCDIAPQHKCVLHKDAPQDEDWEEVMKQRRPAWYDELKANPQRYNWLKNAFKNNTAQARHDAFKECVELIKTLSELEDDKDNSTGWKETCEIITKRITSLSQKSHE